MADLQLQNENEFTSQVTRPRPDAGQENSVRTAGQHLDLDPPARIETIVRVKSPSLVQPQQKRKRKFTCGMANQGEISEAPKQPIFQALKKSVTPAKRKGNSLVVRQASVLEEVHRSQGDNAKGRGMRRSRSK